MNAIPMIFNAEMIRALLEERKIVTRRPIKPQPTYSESTGFNQNGWAFGLGADYRGTVRNFVNSKSKIKAGDLIWVRETWSAELQEIKYKADNKKIHITDHPTWNRADLIHANSTQRGNWRPSIHMPRWASRLTLRVTNVRVEQIRNISEESAIDEGIERIENNSRFFHAYFPLGNKNGLRCCSSAVESYRGLWESIYGDQSWDENPWTWVIEFEVIGKNIDQVLAEMEAA